MEKLVSRKYEQSVLKNAVTSGRSEFIALYGRRRIGKTFLINEYFKNYDLYLEFTGTKDGSAKSQLKNFSRAIGSKNTFSDWGDAFLEVEAWINKKSKQKKIIFFDELPWLASRKSGFLEALEYFWNSRLSKRKDIVLIVCGSSASWMIKNVINNKGGLHNRLTIPPLSLAPFTLKETKEFFDSRGIDITIDQLTEIYMVTGGVAHYLNLYQKGESSSQFINRNFFSRSGELGLEFDRLFQSLFDRFDFHVHVVKLLAKHPMGLSQSEIAKSLKISTGGTFTKILGELEKSSFIQFTSLLGNKKKDGVYKLIDEYSNFYLTWRDLLGVTVNDNLYWQKQVGKPKYNSWLGNSFEILCLKHIEQIIHALGISGLTNSIHCFRNENAQIDLVIERSDKTINLCEIKFSQAAYQTTEEDVKKLKKRKEELKLFIGPRKQVFITLITPYPAIKNKHYLSSIDQEINLEKFF